MCAVTNDLGDVHARLRCARHPPGWRDPRLWIGIAIVAVSVVAGARLLAAADDSVTVWAAAADLGGRRHRRPPRTSRRGRCGSSTPPTSTATSPPTSRSPPISGSCAALAGASCCPGRRSAPPARATAWSCRSPSRRPGARRRAAGSVVDVYVVRAAAATGAPVLAGVDGRRGAAGRPTSLPSAGSGRWCSASSRRRSAAVLPGHGGRSTPRPSRSSGGGDAVVVVLVLAAGAALGVDRPRPAGGAAGIVVLKRCVDVDDLLAAASAGQADVAVLGVDAPGLDQAAVDHAARPRCGRWRSCPTAPGWTRPACAPPGSGSARRSPRTSCPPCPTRSWPARRRPTPSTR